MSEFAYGPSVYVRITDSNRNCGTRLLYSKSRVAPLKSILLPRLELCAAVLLAKLIMKVKLALPIDIREYHLWIDSTIILTWIAAPTNRWKSFVANRVAEIHDLTNSCYWHHINIGSNPAHANSRGMSALALTSNTL